jgi:hypothetical protein
MQPIIRIACFILLIISLNKISIIAWLLILPLLLMLYRLDHSLISVLPMIKRLRWLFISIFILHLWFSAPEFTWLPPWEGWIHASKRVSALIFIVLAAHLLLRTTRKAEIIAALQWWLLPLNRLGLPTQRLAVRLALVLETVETVQTLYTEQHAGISPRRYSVSTISQRAAELFNQVAMHAEQAPLQCLEIPDMLSPPWWQWIYILILLLICTF